MCMYLAHVTENIVEALIDVGLSVIFPYGRGINRGIVCTEPPWS